MYVIRIFIYTCIIYVCVYHWQYFINQHPSHLHTFASNTLTVLPCLEFCQGTRFLLLLVCCGLMIRKFFGFYLRRQLAGDTHQSILISHFVYLMSLLWINAQSENWKRFRKNNLRKSSRCANSNWFGKTSPTWPVLGAISRGKFRRTPPSPESHNPIKPLWELDLQGEVLPRSLPGGGFGCCWSRFFWTLTECKYICWGRGDATMNKWFNFWIGQFVGDTAIASRRYVRLKCRRTMTKEASTHTGWWWWWWWFHSRLPVSDLLWISTQHIKVIVSPKIHPD